MAEQYESEPSRWEQNVLQNILLTSVKEQRSGRRWGIFFKSAFLLYLIFVLFLFWPSNRKKLEYRHPHTALVTIEGVISPTDEANADAIVTGLRNAFESGYSKGIILRINSPGGSPVQSSYIYNEIRRLRARHPEKKLYAVISDVGGSGGYFVACAADEIYANESSIVGSIGVLMPNFGFTETIQKLGIEQRTITAGENKMFLDPFSPVVEQQQAFAQKLVGNIHHHFIQAVKEGRGERLKEDPTIFSGLFWTGDQA
ncbi:MAG TPA: S49 family peptidase, partial [Gammaproteobacteria bacterium]|nr:S49 family peptidase [Gammaproteobacteria bacterium]